MVGLKLNHVSKRGPRSPMDQCVNWVPPLVLWYGQWNSAFYLKWLGLYQLHISYHCSTFLWSQVPGLDSVTAIKTELSCGRCDCLPCWVAEQNAYISEVFVSNRPLTFVHYTWVCMYVYIYIYMNFHRCSPLLKLLLGWCEMRVFWNIYFKILAPPTNLKAALEGDCICQNLSNNFLLIYKILNMFSIKQSQFFTYILRWHHIQSQQYFISYNIICGNHFSTNIILDRSLQLPMPVNPVYSWPIQPKLQVGFLIKAYTAIRSTYTQLCV